MLYQLNYFYSPTALANGVFSPDKLRCVLVRVAGAGSGGKFRKVPESSGVCWCRFRRRVPEGSGGFWRVPARVGLGSGKTSGVRWCTFEAGFRRFWRVPVWCFALQPWQEWPYNCFDYGGNIVHMGKTIAQKSANIVKYGIRHKDIYAIAVGDITKAYLRY